MNTDQLTAYFLGACLSNIPTNPKKIKPTKYNAIVSGQTNFWIVLGVLPKAQNKSQVLIDSKPSPMVFPGIKM